MSAHFGARADCDKAVASAMVEASSIACAHYQEPPTRLIVRAMLREASFIACESLAKALETVRVSRSRRLIEYQEARDDVVAEALGVIDIWHKNAWDDTPPTFPAATSGTVDPQAYIRRLEKYALDSDGMRCDTCALVWDIDEGDYGEDQRWLCRECGARAGGKP